MRMIIGPDGMEWIRWSERPPTEDEASFVIFYNRLIRRYEMQIGTVVPGPYWYDLEPVAWMPMPQMPGEFLDNKFIKGETQ